MSAHRPRTRSCTGAAEDVLLGAILRGPALRVVDDERDHTVGRKYSIRPSSDALKPAMSPAIMATWRRSTRSRGTEVLSDRMREPISSRVNRKCTEDVHNFDHL